MTPPDLKDIIKKEYVKCAKDPVYFMKKYCVIQHPIQGKINFNLYDFQVKIIDQFIEWDYNIILKARQLGISTLVAGYSLWLMLFNDDKNVLVIATKTDVAKNLVTKVKVMHENLPSWMRSRYVEDNKLSMSFTNGSIIKAISSSPESARSEALSLLIIDEAAFIERVDKIWEASANTLSTGGRGIILSTPNGVGNFFHKKWIEAIAGLGEFNPIELKWDVHPDRDQVWRDKQTDLLGPKGASQESDCSFITSGNTVVEGETIKFYEDTYIRDPDEIRRGKFAGNYWLWEFPIDSKSYIVCADVGRGDATDYSTFHVLEVETLTQVAEYKGHVGTGDFGDMLYQVGTEWNDALLIVENSNIGWATLQKLIDREYKNLFYSSIDLKYVDVYRQITNKLHNQDKKLVPGFTTSLKNRPLFISKLETYMRNNEVIFRSQRLIDELFVFIWKGNKAQAMRGYNDDLVMAMGIGLWVRDTALRLRTQGIELTKSAIDQIGVTSTKFEPIYTQDIVTRAKDSWKIDFGDEKDSLEWLL